MDNYIAFIPVRGGSKSIPLKNIRKIHGRPLVYWVLDAAVKCAKIDRVYLCTDSKIISDKIEEYICQNNCKEKLRCIDRPPETATDNASTESALVYFGQQYADFNHIILIQATSPLLTADDLTNAIANYELNGYDSLLSVVRQKRFCWTKGTDGFSPINYNVNSRPRRQEFDGYLVENGAFYINTRENLLRDKCRLSGKIGVYEMSEDAYFEIDEPSDWVIIEQLLKNRTGHNADLESKLSRIKMLLTDCDGVLTDGGMYYSENGDELKKFNTKDGNGIQMLRNHGIFTGIITGESVKLNLRRAEKLKIDEIHIGVQDKAEVVGSILEKYNLSWDEVAYIGDDTNDLSVMKKVGLSCCPNDAAECVRRTADYISPFNGGAGVVRDVAEKILSRIIPNAEVQI